jgi:hypothetical protein
MWSTDGCVFVERESNRFVTVCECDHLTNFAALMDYSERNDITKSIITQIFCGLSVISLVVNISLQLYKKSRNKLSFTKELKNHKIVITLNLCFCLIIANLLIIFGMDEIDTNPKVSLEIASFKVSINISYIFSVDMSINISPFTLFIIGIIFMDAYRRITYTSIYSECFQETNKI